MPRPLSLAGIPSSLQRESDSISISPTVKKAKNRLSKLLHRKNDELKDFSRSYDLFREPSKRTKAKHRQSFQPVESGTQDPHWHKLSMVSERDEPATPVRTKRHWVPTRPPLRPSLDNLEQMARAESSRASSVQKRISETKRSAATSKHDSILTDYESLCAVPQENDDDDLRSRREGGPMFEMLRLGMARQHRTPSCSAPIPCSIISDYSQSEGSHCADDLDPEPVSPMVPHSPVEVQVTASDVANLPDFSFVPNAIRRKHQSDAFVATFRDCTNIITDWQVECFRLRKQLKAVELQLRYKAELLASEQTRTKVAELELDRMQVELRRAVEETQLLKVSNGLKHDESCALKAKLGVLQVSDQSRHKELTRKLRAMAERLALEEDAVADKDLRIKWLEKERSELERENRVLENVKGALWNHMEIASKRKQAPASPASPTMTEPRRSDATWWI